MEKIKWCLKVKNGIELIEPNDNLSLAYVKKAEDALRASAVLEGNPDWKISSSYYAIYFSLYSILMKIGIKCEVHACTIKIVEVFLKKYFTKEDNELFSLALKSRINTQYYSDRNISEWSYLRITTEAARIFSKSKQVLAKITSKEITEIRFEMEKIKEKN